jgi:hypothetical protein
MLASICQPPVLPKKINHWSVTMLNLISRLMCRLTDAGYVGHGDR